MLGRLVFHIGRFKCCEIYVEWKGVIASNDIFEFNIFVVYLILPRNPNRVKNAAVDEIESYFLPT